MNKLGFKTFEEFEKDIKDEIINNLTDEEKLDLHNRYCEDHYDYDSIIHLNDDEFLDTVFSNYLNEITARGITEVINNFSKAFACNNYKYDDEYMIFGELGNLKSYSNLQTALEDNFVDSEVIDLILEDKNIDIKSLYDDYICDTLDEARDKMSPEEFSDTLKEYSSRKMQIKYEDVYDNIMYKYSNHIIDKIDYSKNPIDKILER